MAAWVDIDGVMFVNLSQVVTAFAIETDNPPGGGLIAIKDANGQTHYKSNNGSAYASQADALAALTGAIGSELGGAI